MRRQAYMFLILVLAAGLAVGCRPQEQPATWSDGEFIGVGQGWGGDIRVRVTIANGEITNVEILEENETTERAERSLQDVPDRIVETQSTDVEAISGATRTTEGIIQAVEDALQQAAQG